MKVATEKRQERGERAKWISKEAHSSRGTCECRSLEAEAPDLGTVLLQA